MGAKLFKYVKMEYIRPVITEIVYIFSISATGYCFGRGMSELAALMTAITVFSSLHRYRFE